MVQAGIGVTIPGPQAGAVVDGRGAAAGLGRRAPRLKLAARRVPAEAPKAARVAHLRLVVVAVAVVVVVVGVGSDGERHLIVADLAGRLVAIVDKVADKRPPVEERRAVRRRDRGQAGSAADAGIAILDRRVGWRRWRRGWRTRRRRRQRWRRRRRRRRRWRRRTQRIAARRRGRQRQRRGRVRRRQRHMAVDAVERGQRGAAVGGRGQARAVVERGGGAARAKARDSLRTRADEAGEILAIALAAGLPESR